VEIADFKIHTLPSPHDGAEASFFVISDGKRNAGYFLDIGHPFPRLEEYIERLDGLIIEANHDIHMLKTGPYPAFLQRRIRGRGGHISNCEAGALLRRSNTERLQWVVFGHLSQKNNCHHQAEQTLREILPADFFREKQIIIVPHGEGTPPLRL